MAITKLPSGRLRVTLHDPITGKKRTASSILGHAPTSFPGGRDGMKEAKAYEVQAMVALGVAPTTELTVEQWRDRWLTDPLFIPGGQGKQSTRNNRAAKTKEFARRYGAMPLRHVTDEVVAQYRVGGTRETHLPILRTMFNDAKSPRAGRLITVNPFSGYDEGRAKSHGNRDVHPPSEDIVWKLINAATRKTSGGRTDLSAWLQVAAYTGMRPGELDGLRVENLDFDRRRIHVVEQYTPRGAFTSPKNGQAREALMTPNALAALQGLDLDREFVFNNSRGGHLTASGRTNHWNACRAHADYEGTLYLATRHFAGWYLTNVLNLPYKTGGAVLGHTDNGELMRLLYGHTDIGLELDRGMEAFDNVRPLRAVDDDDGAAGALARA